jgi:hypothetical protein
MSPLAPTYYRGIPAQVWWEALHPRQRPAAVDVPAAA